MPRAIFRAAALAVFLAACSDGGSEPRTEVVVSPATQSRVAGETQQYTATVNGAAATAGQVTWSSSNTSVATVNASTGLATAVGAGTTKIRATVGGDYDEADLTVIANTAPTVVANADLDVSAGTTVSLTSTGTDAESQAITYRWTQTAGTDVTGGAGFLTGQNPTFTAPSSVGVLRFSVTATDAVGASGAADEVVVWVLEDAAKAVWVRPTGDDAAAGTRAAPFKTLSKALTQAMNNGGWDVYLGEGVYAEAVTVRDDVSMYGGWATDFGARYPTSDAAHRSTIRAAGTALVGTAVTDLTLNGLDIEALAPVTDRSTYGIRLHSAQRVVISSNRITSAAGAPGSAGGPGGNGTQGFNGGNSPGLVTPGNGGGNGGMGGRGATESAPALPGAPGAGGTGAGGGGGPGGLPATSSSAAGTGVNGANGAFGSTGSGGADFGFVGGTGYVPAGGGSGGQGGQGGGGGGGGGGRNVTIVFVNYHGGGGGGGGGGGFGGGGGGGGSGGGGSFGIVLVLPTNVTVNANVITTNAGGAGGAGGGGGAGGAGGNGGFGYLTGSNDFRSGGDGGRGGNGGNGGNGGGGGGGPSIGILVSGGTSTQTNNTLNVGAGGVGGAPFGVAGRSAGIVTLP